MLRFISRIVPIDPRKKPDVIMQEACQGFPRFAASRAEKACGKEPFTKDAPVKAKAANQIFEQCIIDYHRTDNVDQPISNTHSDLGGLLYAKCWIDTVQWHLEDIIRSPNLPADRFIATKRRIDKSNQDRTDAVEKMDDWFLERFKNVKTAPDARMNSETPAWLLDRMSILQLKIYHMREQTQRKDADAAHTEACARKLSILKEQEADLELCFDQLFDDLAAGTRRMKVYRQMKMYNDPKLNPILYGGAKAE